MLSSVNPCGLATSADAEIREVGMSENDKTRRGDRASRFCDEIDGGLNNIAVKRSCQRPRMGSALRAFLSRYAGELRVHEEETGERTGEEVGCCDFLIIEADRRGGGR